nr:LOW QUALITY PROTEIN: XK-related protein 8 [Columba livia]
MSMMVHLSLEAPPTARRADSSIVCFLWNLFLTCPRVLAVALFTLPWPYCMAARVLLVRLAMFLCASLQGTDSVESPVPEQLYWAIVAMILYRSWFTVAPGWTLGCSIIHHGFILVSRRFLNRAAAEPAV